MGCRRQPETVFLILSCVYFAVFDFFKKHSTQLSLSICNRSVTVHDWRFINEMQSKIISILQSKQTFARLTLTF